MIKKMRMLMLGVLLSVISLSGMELTDLVDKTNCDRIIDKKYFTICYSDKNKGALAGWTKLDGSLVNKKNIKKKPRYYEDAAIPEKHRSKYSDYTGLGYDFKRGHIIVADADVDYSKESLKSSYVMSQIVPQSASVNQKTWIKVEKYGRSLASKLGYVNSVTVINYKRYSPKRIKNGISIPYGFYRAYYNKEKAFEKCFYYENKLNIIVRNDKLKEHIVNCARLKMSMI
jgi:endonuclease G